jgi:hypothetical protein
MQEKDSELYVSLKHYFETILEQFQISHRHEHELVSKSVESAEKALNVRLDSMNEFRAQIQSERNLYATREALDLKFDMRDKTADLKANLIDTRIAELEKQINYMRGRQAAFAVGIILVFSAIEVVMRVVGI